MSDNSALQCIGTCCYLKYYMLILPSAVILPRVKVHFDLTSEVVALLSASTMAGVSICHPRRQCVYANTAQMMIGAVGWGTVSDLLGRALPFNVTLFLTAVFGIGASFAPTFPILLVWMFLLGSAVGWVIIISKRSELTCDSGSMPTDGTLFLENLPHSKQYLLTLLSVFFSLGAVLSSVISLIFLPGSSCKQFEGCDIAGKQNDGWRRVLFVLGIFVSPHDDRTGTSLTAHRTYYAPLRDGVCFDFTNHRDTWCQMVESRKPSWCCKPSRRITIRLWIFKPQMCSPLNTVLKRLSTILWARQSSLRHLLKIYDRTGVAEENGLLCLCTLPPVQARGTHLLLAPPGQNTLQYQSGHQLLYGNIQYEPNQPFTLKRLHRSGSRTKGRTSLNGPFPSIHLLRSLSQRPSFRTRLRTRWDC